MPTKTLEPLPKQSDTGTRPSAGEKVEPRNFEPGDHGSGRNSDAPSESEPARFDYEEINTHGSER